MGEPLDSIAPAATSPVTVRGLFGQRSKRRVGARYFEYRATGKFHWSLFSPFHLEAFSRIHPSINSRHKVVRRHTSSGQRGAKSENLATRFSCTESWAVQRLAPL